MLWELFMSRILRLIDSDKSETADCRMCVGARRGAPTLVLVTVGVLMWKLLQCVRGPGVSPRVGVSLLQSRLIARVTGGGLFDLLNNATEVVGFRSLQRRVFFVRQQMRQP